MVTMSPDILTTTPVSLFPYLTIESTIAILSGCSVGNPFVLTWSCNFRYKSADSLSLFLQLSLYLSIINSYNLLDTVSIYECFDPLKASDVPSLNSNMSDLSPVDCDDFPSPLDFLTFPGLSGYSEGCSHTFRVSCAVPRSPLSVTSWTDVVSTLIKYCISLTTLEPPSFTHAG